MTFLQAVCACYAKAGSTEVDHEQTPVARVVGSRVGRPALAVMADGLLSGTESLSLPPLTVSDLMSDWEVVPLKKHRNEQPQPGA